LVMVEIALSPLHADGQPHVLAAIRAIGDYPRVRQALQRAKHAEAIAQMARLAVDSGDSAALLQAAPRLAAQALEAEAAALFLLDSPGRNVGCVAAFGAPLAAPSAEQIAALASAPSAGPSPWRVAIAERGRTIGALYLQPAAHTTWGDDARRFLESLASLLATVLQRQTIEDALRHAQRLEAVGQLTGGIAHDFNNLLTVIQGNLQVLEDLPSLASDASAQELVAAASRASRRGGELTGKLLAFSRRQLLQPRAIDLAAMLRSLASLLQRTLDARIRIELALPDADSASCLADPAQLEAALLNLAINARDAMPDGGTLRFGVEPCALPPPGADAFAWANGGVALSVADTGCGMSDAVRARAFEPFFTTKESGRGTGLGLATVHGFVHQSQGVVTLDSRVGAGTRVTLYLPSPADAAPRRAKTRDAEPTVPAGLSVLLVEDEPDVLRVVLAFLEQWGCSVVGCSHAEAALQAAAAPDTRFDLLLTDVVLGPGLRGDQLAQRLRAAQPALAVLLMSGYAQDLQAAASDLGPLLRKPFTREQLAQAVLAATGPR
jgi:signal transduction histidine kinase